MVEAQLQNAALRFGKRLFDFESTDTRRHTGGSWSLIIFLWKFYIIPCFRLDEAVFNIWLRYKQFGFHLFKVSVVHVYPLLTIQSFYRGNIVVAMAGKEGGAATPGSPANNADPPPGPEKWGEVILTISNSVLPLEKLSPTPSSVDGMSQAVEDDLRNLGCNLIQTAGKLLRLPQVAMATGCVLFQRFFYAKSFVTNSMEVVAMGCVCLACKIEEAQPARRVRDVINVFTHIKQVRQGKPIKPVILDGDYIRLKNDVIKAERRVLKDLGFCVHIKHPHKLVVMYMQFLGFQADEKFVQMSWNFMNDSLRTDCFVRYQPETIACACIYLSARKLAIPLPRHPAW